MLMIGSAGRNVGKTELATMLLRKYGTSQPIVALKVTAVDRNDGLCPRGGKGCGVCSSLSQNYLISEETGDCPGKDTTRLREAGASRVLWLRSLRTHLDEAFSILQSHIGNAVSICESTSLRRCVQPDLFLLAKHADAPTMKPSARALLAFADRMLVSNGTAFDFDVGRICLHHGRWGIKERATAIILAGGRSARMGTEKALLPVLGKTLIQHVADQLIPNFDEVLVSANDPDRFAFLGLPVVLDSQPDQGPLRGIASGLAAARNDTCFVVACDIPDIDMPLVRRMLAQIEGCSGVVPSLGNGLFEPLFAVYSRDVSSVACRILDTGERRIAALFSDLQFRFPDLSSHPSRTLANLNRIEDYESYLRTLKGP